MVKIMSWKDRFGLIYIYIGNGKGKIMVVFGFVVRMFGLGGKVVIV